MKTFNIVRKALHLHEDASTCIEQSMHQGEAEAYLQRVANTTAKGSFCGQQLRATSYWPTGELFEYLAIEISN